MSKRAEIFDVLEDIEQRAGALRWGVLLERDVSKLGLEQLELLAQCCKSQHLMDELENEVSE